MKYLRTINFSVFWMAYLVYELPVAVCIWLLVAGVERMTRVVAEVLTSA
jgi:hypothetical protein